MLIMGSKFKGNMFFSLVCVVIAARFLIGCATSTTTERPSQESGAAIIEAIKVSSPGGTMTVVEIVSSRPAPYTAFQLINPARVVLDVRGMLGSNLSQKIEVNDGNVKDILLQKSTAKDMSAKVVFNLARTVDYEVGKNDKIITLTFMPKRAAVEDVLSKESKVSAEPLKTQGDNGSNIQPAKPRIFFEPRPTSLNQVLGVDFTMLDHGKSLLTVTTDKKIRYDLKRKGPKSVVLTLEKTSIPPLLLRHLDSSHFEGVVDRVKPSFNSTDSRLSLFIFLREMVPFHVNQTESVIQIHFAQTAIKPPEKKLVPQNVIVAQKNSPKDVGAKKEVSVREEVRIPGLKKARYTGAPMTMNFVNADVTNVLRLIGEVSKLNIIWGPEVKGTVSMRLEKVPWDQALDLVLANNDLAMRRQGKVIWITSRAHMAKLEAEERKKREDAEAEAEARRKRRLEAKEETKKLEPLVTEYFPLDFAKAKEIKVHIEAVKSQRGNVSVDERTNTIIVKDIASIIGEVKKIVERFDAPVKQVMIEARIVDATTNFTRDLGVQWGSLDGARPGFERRWRQHEGTPWGTAMTDFTTYGDLITGGTFASNAPEGWGGNIGLSFAMLTNRGLGLLALDASLALAETEGNVKIISAPKVIASNGEKALISKGDIIYKEVVTADRVDTKELKAVLSLAVTPTVSFNDYVTMDIEVTDDKALTVDYKLEKRIETKLMIRSGETIVIGGIYKEDKTEDEAGVPWLREAPVLGWLFKAQRKKRDKTELLIFLTPKVIQTIDKKI